MTDDRLSDTDPGDRRRDSLQLPPPAVTGPRPGTAWGRFQVQSLLGQGGMGRVWRAFDPGLRRAVALKTLRQDDPRAAERLLFEARAQARVDHENVCKVYEVGEVEGAPYIAMQLIAGRPLKEAVAGLSSEQIVAVLRQVAEGVQAAHRTGLIHRDLKPSNVLVERNDDGDLRPYVLDFGVARDTTGEGLTRTGLAVGSVHYMAPEQAFGEHVDCRVDVWGLGATLYELLAGDSPFAGGSETEVLLRLRHSEPPAIARKVPGLPRDLALIVMKCLERDPARRYASVQAFADDLGRYLAGEPIAARPSGWIYRTAKRIRRHRAVAAVTAISLLAVAVLGSYAWWARWQASRTALAAQRFGREVQEIEGALRAAYLLPLHDLRPDRARVAAQMQALRREMRDLGGLAAGPGHYALGRGLLALHRLEEAQAELATATRLGFAGPEVHFALGRVLAERYQQGVEDASRLSDPELSIAHRRAVEQNFLLPARAELRASQDAPGLGRSYLLALLAFCEERLDEAGRLARRAFAEDPSRFEALGLLGDVALQRARDALNRGDHTAAEESLEAGRASYAAAADVARSAPDIREDECALETVAIDLDLARGAAMVDHLARARAACDGALVAEPGAPRPLASEAHTYLRLGEKQQITGQDPLPSLQTAVALATRALAGDPRSAEALRERAGAELRLGELAVSHGDDPRAWFARSGGDARAAIAIVPGYADGYSLLAFSELRLGEWRIGQGSDPSAELDHAIAHLRQGIALNPRLANLHHRLGYTLFLKATEGGMRGADPRPLLREAMASYQRSLALNPQVVALYSNLGNAHSRAGEYELIHGLEASPDLFAAIASYRRALELQPAYAVAHGNLGAAYLLRGEYEAKRGLDPRTSFALARDEFHAAIQLNRDDPFDYGNLGQLAVDLADYLLQRGASPVEVLAEGKRDLAASLKLNPNDADEVRGDAELDLRAARWQHQRHGAVALLLDTIARTLARSTTLNPNDARTWADLAELAELRALEAAPAAVPAAIDAGLEAAAKAEALNPDLVGAAAVAGRLALLRAQRASDVSRRQAATAAVAALRRAQHLDPLGAAALAPALAEAEALSHP